ncbi:MAG: helix-turn-helix domain-containing protein [Deferrisomatales bacterium]
MAMSARELGRRLRMAREACGMTQEAVAQNLETSRPTVTQMELGNRPVTATELDRLAYLFGRDVREFFAEEFQEVDAMAALFRALPDVPQQGEAVDAVRKCLAMGRELAHLEHVLEIDRERGVAVAYALTPPRGRWDAIQQGERVAEEERRRLGLGSVPAGDVEELLEGQGVRVAVVSLPRDVSGLTLREREAGFFVVVNRDQHSNRRGFSLAHEYAHVLLDHARIGTVSRTANHDDLIEIRASAFAAAFLLPPDGIRRLVTSFGKGRPSRSHVEVFDEGEEVLRVQSRAEPKSQAIQLHDVVILAHVFGVSRLAALYRLHNLKLLTEAELERLRVEEASGKGRVVEKQVLALPEPEHEKARNSFRRRFLSLALEAYRREDITRAKLGELAAMVDLGDEELGLVLADAGLEPLAFEADLLLPEGLG